MNFLLLCLFLSLWIHPKIEDVELIFDLIILLMFELIMIISSIFMNMMIGVRWKEWLCVILFFGAFAFTFNSAVSGNQILILYCSMVLNRILSGIFSKNKTDKKQKKTISTFNFSIYFGLIFTVAMCSAFIPKLGLTDEFLKAANYININRIGSGYITEIVSLEALLMPHTFMCFGVLYYLILTFVEMISIIQKLRVSLTNQ